MSPVSKATRLRFLCLTLVFVLVTTTTVCAAPDAVAPAYSIESYHSEMLSQNYSALKKFEHYDEYWDHQRHDNLKIEVIQATPSSIHLRWRQLGLQLVNSTWTSKVICETPTGRFVSDRLLNYTSSFRVEHLHPDTTYLICVYLLEKGVNTSILHYRCQDLATIPTVRSDSVWGVILTLGYLFLMGGIGYLVWWRRMKKLRKKEEDEERLKIEAAEEYEALENHEDKGYENPGAQSVSSPEKHSKNSTPPVKANKGRSRNGPAAAAADGHGDGHSAGGGGRRGGGGGGGGGGGRGGNGRDNGGSRSGGNRGHPYAPGPNIFDGYRVEVTAATIPQSKSHSSVASGGGDEDDSQDEERRRGCFGSNDGGGGRGRSSREEDKSPYNSYYDPEGVKVMEIAF